MNAIRAVTLSCLIIALAGCKTMEETGWLPPKPKHSKYLQTTQGYFELNMNKERTDLFGSYAIEIAVSSELPRPAYTKITFQMPEKKSPWVVESEIKKGQSTLRIQSENSRAWKHYQSYRVEIFLYSDAERMNQIDYLEQFIRFERPPVFQQ